MGDLERMGRELKCPICLSLIDSAVSLTCNHIFCNSCIFKSMKSASACPVCKVPFTRREVRPAPHMDNLVSIYKSMEVASGISMFVTQNDPATKLSDGEKQCEGDADSGKKEAGGTHKNHVQEKKSLKRKKSRKKINTSMKNSGSDFAKPSFPAKKRVQVPQNLLSETPLKNLKFGNSPSAIIKEGTEKVSVMANESNKDDHIRSPFFWLREEEDGEKLSQHINEDQLIDGSTPIPPSFSDLKDSDDENPSKAAPSDEVQNKASADLFDSEMFEWTQRPCSPELFSSPFRMQVVDAGEIDENHEELVADSQELKTNQSSAFADKGKTENPKEGNRLADVFPPSVFSPQIISYDDLNGIQKSTKRRRKASEKARQEQIVEQNDPIDGMNVDLNISLRGNQEQARDYKHKSSNLGKTNRRGKRVCFNTSKNLTPQTACTVSNVLGVLSNDEVNMAKNSHTSPCKQESGKHCPQDIAGKSQINRSGKQKLDYVQDVAKDLSSMQDQANEFAGSTSSFLSLQANNDVKASNSRQSKNNFSRKSISCSRELRSTKMLKLSSDCISTTKNSDGVQPNESRQRGPDVRALNNPSKEKHCPLVDEPVLRKCESHVKMYQCAFCLSSEESKVSGPMVHYFEGKPVIADYEGGSKVTHCHRNCTEWAPNVYFEDDNAINLEAEINRSRRIKCSFCGLKGAALGCYDKSCRRSFHVPCAKLTSQCRWDMENFVMLCPIHASSILPCESSVSQERSKKCTVREVKSGGRKHETTSQNRTVDGSYKKIVLCCSALSVQERDVVSEFKRVSKVTVLKNWDSSVTHVIASIDENGACRRTLKVLLGILEGKWILNIEWIRACLKETKPVDEEHYEINVDIHGIRDGPRVGRLRALNKQPKLFDGYKFYFMGDFKPSYKSYLQDLVIAAGGIILHRKPVSGDPEAMSPDMHPYQTLIIYSLELPDKCNPLKTDTIFSQRQRDAEVLASSTGSKVASNTWILNSIAACKLQSHPQ
ncbi:protein BREAST CANCER SUSCEPTIBILITY 1 homolog [Gastrolobium bilobum]|uniref:protein BREAST CANCER SUSCEPTIBILITY 1 homolog n=1 Tax=Gastrolobium bilobum TaxID=150636 RepID=UPI002AB0AAF1|nr:protein BREAST CANCER SUSCEPTIBILITY 1 homolog [Gastrolobium bilobum]